MDSSGGSQTHVVIVDLRRSLKKDYRFTTFVKVLEDVTTMAYTMAGCCPWAHLGIIWIREDKSGVLLGLQELNLLSLNRLDEIFQQLNQTIDSELNPSFFHHYDDNVSKKSWDLNSALQNALKQYRELKASRGELWITVVTIQWEVQAKTEIRKFQRKNCTKNISYRVQVLDIGDLTLRSERLDDNIILYSIPVRGISIALEATLKTWLKGNSPKLVLVFPGKDIEITCQTESPIMDPQSINTGSKNLVTSVPSRLNVCSFIPITALCPSHMYGQCHSVSPVISRIENYNRYEALWKFIDEKKVAIITQTEDAKSQIYAIFPGSEVRMILQPIVSSELVLPFDLDEDLLISQPTPRFEDLACQLPFSDVYGLGFEANLISHLRNICLKKDRHDNLGKLSDFELKEPAFHGSRQSACLQPDRLYDQKRSVKPKQTRRGVPKNLANALPHPALGMYKSN